MIGAASFSHPYLCIQPPLKSLPKIHFCTSVNFLLPITPLLVRKIILTISTNTLFLYNSVILYLLIFTSNLLNNLHQKYFPTSTIESVQAASMDQEARNSCESWHCFNISPSSMDNDNKVHNGWLLIAQAQKIGVLPRLPPYPANTITRTHIPLETSCIASFSSILI